MGRLKSDYFVPKYTKKLQEFICDKIEEGITLAEVCKKYGPPENQDVPNEKTMYRWMKKYPEFKLAINEAYKTLLMRLIDKKVMLANRAQDLTKLVNDADEDTDYSTALTDQIKRAKFELDSIKVQQKALEFLLTRIAPKFVEDLRDAPKNQMSALPSINIISFANKPADIKVIDSEAESK